MRSDKKSLAGTERNPCRKTETAVDGGGTTGRMDEFLMAPVPQQVILLWQLGKGANETQTS